MWREVHSTKKTSLKSLQVALDLARRDLADVQ